MCPAAAASRLTAEAREEDEVEEEEEDESPETNLVAVEEEEEEEEEEERNDEDDEEEEELLLLLLPPFSPLSELLTSVPPDEPCHPESPCVCNLVFNTSKGQVAAAASDPASAPEIIYVVTFNGPKTGVKNFLKLSFADTTTAAYGIFINRVVGYDLHKEITPSSAEIERMQWNKPL